MLEASTSELTVIKDKLIETEYRGYYLNQVVRYTTFRFGLKLTAEMKDDLFQKLLFIKDANQKVLEQITNQPPQSKPKSFSQRLKYLFTVKLN